MKFILISAREFTFSVVESKEKLSLLPVPSLPWFTGAAAFVNGPPRRGWERSLETFNLSHVVLSISVQYTWLLKEPHVLIRKL